MEAKTKTIRQRDIPVHNVPVRKEKDTRNISFTVTKAEKEDIDKYITHFGELSHIIRNALRKWLVERKQQEAMLVRAVEKCIEVGGSPKSLNH